MSKSSLIAILITSIIIMISIIIGCNNDRSIGTNTIDSNISHESLLSTELTDCRVEIIDTILDLSDKSITFDMNVYFDGYQNDNRQFKIHFYEDDGERIGYTTGLYDNKKLLWEFDYSMSLTIDSAVWFIERTPSDSLKIIFKTNNDEYAETYILNGNEKEFTFDADIKGKISSLYNQLKNNGFQISQGELELLSSEDEKAIRTLQAFSEFYATDNSLHDNRNGQLVADILTNQDIYDWVQTFSISDKYYSTYMVCKKSKAWEKVCEAAAICAAIKCAGGGPSNPACDVCAAATLACAVMDFFNLW